MTKIGLCILGCGNFAKIFAESIQPLLPDINLYFASRDPDKAHNYSKRFNGTGAFGSYLEAARDPDVHCLYICTPHHMHLEHAILCARYNKHILVEKPIATTLEEGLLMIEAAQKSKVNLMVAENYRFTPAARLCKTLVEQGSIGKVRSIQIQEETHYIPREWRANIRQNGGGVFIDAGIHKIHLLRYLLGDPYSIYAVKQTSSEPDRGESGLIFIGQWPPEAVGLIYHSWTPIASDSHNWVSLSGPLGKIYFEINKPQIKLQRLTGNQYFKLSEPLNGILPMVREFLDSIIYSRDPEITGQEGLKDLELVIQSYLSSDTNNPVTMSSIVSSQFNRE